MRPYLLLVFVHVAAATALLASSVLGSPAMRRGVRRARATRELRTLLAVARPLAVVEPAAALLVLASGVYLASMARFWTLGWVQVATAFWIVNAVLAGALAKPPLARVARAAAETTDEAIGEPLHALRCRARGEGRGAAQRVNSGQARTPLHAWVGRRTHLWTGNAPDQTRRPARRVPALTNAVTLGGRDGCFLHQFPPAHAQRPPAPSCVT